MPLSIHPKAEEAYNTKAEEVLAMVRQRVETTEPMDNDFLTIAGIPVPVEVMWQSLEGSDIRSGAAFPFEGRAIRIEGDDFLAISRLAGNIQSQRGFSEAVSVDAILDVLIRWFKERLTATTEDPFVAYLLAWLREHVVERTIVFSIVHLQFQGKLQVNGVEIRQLEVEEIAGWYESFVAIPEANEIATKDRDKWQKLVGGWAAAFVKVVAEPMHALEIAYQKADEAISLLRSFSPALLDPLRRSYCTIYGMAEAQRKTSFSLEVSEYPSPTQELIGSTTGWFLTEERLYALANEGLIHVLALKEVNPPNASQEAVLSALMLYSSAALEARLESKLLHIVAAIESLLLKDDNEPILAAVSRRFAYVVGRKLDERREVRKRFTDAYGARSGFVHRGQSIENHLMVSGFMADAWHFFRLVVHQAARHTTKQGFINSLEDAMLSGPDILTNGEEPPKA